MSGLGGLTRFLRVLGPELKDANRARRLNDTAYELAGGEGPSAASLADLRDYLRNEGADPAWQDMWPGAMPTQQKTGWFIHKVPPVSPEETWYRGASPSLKLKEPTFTTRSPEGATWYAMEGPAANYNGYGAIGEYLVPKANPARLRDMYRLLLDDPKLLQGSINHANYNIWDYMFDPNVRQAMLDKGFDSGLGLDPLERADIEIFVALKKNLLEPQRRTIIGYPGGLIDETGMPRKPWKYDTDLLQYGETRPWSKRKQGGLVQMRSCK